MKFSKIGALGAGVGVALSAGSALAADNGGGVEEIIVTAQKRAQNIQDVGIAMQAFTSDQLRNLSVQGSTGIAEFTPGVSVSASSGNQQQNVTIRGVTQNDYNDNVESPNAVYLDDGYIPFSQGQTFGLLDLERIEVQKGPQGTLFGRNATGGLLQYITKKPSLDGFSGYADVQTALSDGPADAFHLVTEGAFGGPITGNLAVRVAAKWDQQDPYIKNDYSFRPGDVGPGDGSGIGGVDQFTGRISVLYKPTDNFTSLFSVNGAHARLSVSPFEQDQLIAKLDSKNQIIDVLHASGNETRMSIGANGGDGGWDPTNSGHLIPAPPGGRPVPGGDFSGYKPTRPWVDADGLARGYPGFTSTYGFNLKNIWDVSESVTFTSVTDYKKFDKRLLTNTQASPGVGLLITADNWMDAWDVSQEFRLNGKTGRLTWQTGLYYLLIDLQAENALGLIGPGVYQGSGNRLRTTSGAVFGQADWNFVDKWTLVAGLRGTLEHKGYHFQQALIAQPDPFQFGKTPILVPLGPNPGGAEFVASKNSPLWTGKLQLEYRPQTDLMIYVGINRGVKAGGFNAQLPGGLTIPASYTPYKAETLTNLEGGVKSSWFHRKLQVDVSIFHYDYHNYQAFLFNGVGGFVVNANAKTTGAELTVEAKPIDGLDIISGFSYTHARVHSLPLNVGYDFTRTVEPTYSPPYQASLIVRYSHAFMGGTLSGTSSTVYASRRFYSLRNYTADRFPSYIKQGFGIDWEDPSGHFDVGFNVENVTDQRIGVSGFEQAIVCGCTVVSYQLPRTYILKLRYSY